MKVTLKDIAREAGVAVTTVSRYLNPKGEYISEDALAKIKAAIEKLHYIPRAAIRRKDKKTYEFGLLTSFSKDIFNSRYHTHLLSGIMTAIHDSNYNLKIILLKDKDYAHILDIMQDYNVDGLFILTWRIHPNLIRLIQSCPENLPVMLFNDYDPNVKANFVYSDVGMGMGMAVDHLAKKGRRKIAFLKGPGMIQFGSGKNALYMPSIDAHDKYEGFKKAMEKHGLEERPEWVRECEAYSMTAGFEETTKILEGKDLPDGVVCSNDEVAIGALKALRDKKIKCPDQIAVVGFDGIEKGELTSPPLTTVEQLLNSMGFEAGQKLVEIAEGRLVDPIHTKFVPKLVVRESA